jgi:hypothetical protein
VDLFGVDRNLNSQACTISFEQRTPLQILQAGVTLMIKLYLSLALLAKAQRQEEKDIHGCKS